MRMKRLGMRWVQVQVGTEMGTKGIGNRVPRVGM